MSIAVAAARAARSAQAASAASQTNLMEQPEGSLAVANGGSEVTVPTGAYEIKTVKIAFK